MLVMAMVCGLSAAILYLDPGLNQRLFMALNLSTSTLPDGMLASITVLGEGAVAASLLVGVFCRDTRALSWIFIAALLAGLAIQIPKHYFGSLRPPGMLESGTFHLVGTAYTANAFPSGHSCTALLAATLLTLSFNCLLKRAIFITIGILVALSRVAVGIHWPADIFAGGALGIGLGVLVFRQTVRGVRQLPWWGEGLLCMLLLLLCIQDLTLSTGYDQYWPILPLRMSCAALVGTVFCYRLVTLLWQPMDRFCRMLLGESLWLTLSRFSRFGLVGASGFLVDTALYSVLHTTILQNLLLARAVSYWFTSTWNWYLNRRFTFGDSLPEERLIQLGKYLLMCLCSFAPSLGTFHLLTSNSVFFATHSQLALLGGVVVGALFNYFCSSILIFRVYRFAEVKAA
jgi:membrane-associated phospholipid phosphatase/putative flippase GtrA